MSRNRIHRPRFIRALTALGPLLAIGAILPAAAAASEGAQSAAGILGIAPEMFDIDGRIILGAVAMLGIAVLTLIAAVLSEAFSIARNPVISQAKRRNRR